MYFKIEFSDLIFVVCPRTESHVELALVFYTLMVLCRPTMLCVEETVYKTCMFFIFVLYAQCFNNRFALGRKEALCCV